MSLEEIGDILAGPAATRDWSSVVAERIEALRRQEEIVVASREYLEHVLSHHRDSSPDGCHHYESAIFDASPHHRLSGRTQNGSQANS